MPTDPQAYMGGAIPSGSWVPGNANGISASESRMSNGTSGATSAYGATAPGLHVNPLLGKGPADISRGMLMNPLMMGRMAAFGSAGGMTPSSGTNPGMGRAMGGGGRGGLARRTQSNNNLYHPQAPLNPDMPRQRTSPALTLSPSHSASQPGHAHLQSYTSPRSPLGQSYSSASDDQGYFAQSHANHSPLSPIGRLQHGSRPASRMSRSAPVSPMRANGWSDGPEPVVVSDDNERGRSIRMSSRLESLQESDSCHSYDPPSSLFMTSGSEVRFATRGRSRSRTKHRVSSRSLDHAPDPGSPDSATAWESTGSGGKQRAQRVARLSSPEPVYRQIHQDLAKADSLPVPPPMERVMDGRRNNSHQPGPPSALASGRAGASASARTGTSASYAYSHVDSSVNTHDNSVPLPLVRPPRPGLPRRHTAQVSASAHAHADPSYPQSPSPVPPPNTPAPSARLPRSMSHDAFDLASLAEDLPCSPSPSLSYSHLGGVTNGAGRRTGHQAGPPYSPRDGYISPLAPDSYDRYTAHPSTPSQVRFTSPLPGMGMETGSALGMGMSPPPSASPSPSLAFDAFSGQRRGILLGAAGGGGADSLSTSTTPPQTPSQVVGTDYLPIGFPKPTRKINWNRDGPALKAPGIGWHRNEDVHTPLSIGPVGPNTMQARPPDYGVRFDRADEHGRNWWEESSRV